MPRLIVRAGSVFTVGVTAFGLSALGDGAGATCVGTARTKPCVTTTVEPTTTVPVTTTVESTTTLVETTTTGATTTTGVTTTTGQTTTVPETVPPTTSPRLPDTGTTTGPLALAGLALIVLGALAAATNRKARA